MRVVQGLPLPAMLLDLLAADRWRHPGDTRLQAVIPWIEDPFELVESPEKMAYYAAYVETFLDNPDSAAFLHVARGSHSPTPLALPWVDIEQMVLLMVNRWAGDDQAVALDYRTSRTDPRVIASDWYPHQGCLWREVTPTFSTFVHQLGL